MLRTILPKTVVLPVLDHFAAISRVSRDDVPHRVLVIGERPERARRGRGAIPGDLVHGEDLVDAVAVEVALDDLAEEADHLPRGSVNDELVIRPGDLERADIACVGRERHGLLAGARPWPSASIDWRILRSA